MVVAVRDKGIDRATQRTVLGRCRHFRRWIDTDDNSSSYRFHPEAELRGRGHHAADERGSEQDLLEGKMTIAQDARNEPRRAEQDCAVNQIGEEPGGQDRGAHCSSFLCSARASIERSRSISTSLMSWSATRCDTRAAGSPAKSRSSSSPTIDDRTSSSVIVGR